MGDGVLRIEDLDELGPELDDEQLVAVSGGRAPHSHTAWSCGCTDTDAAF